jgi:mono/diheme cytochrome c family protein
VKGVSAAVALTCCLLAACSKHGSLKTGGASAVQLNNPASSSDGGRIYITNCSSCHQLDGRGLPGAFPALAGNAIVTGDPRTVISIVKFGLRGKILGRGEGFGGVMPPWQGLLSDDDLAAVVTYIRFAWHNRAGPVSAAQVQTVTTPNP